MDHQSLELSQLLAIVKDSLKKSVPGNLWVKAEINELSVNYSGHCYLELIEKSEESENITAKIKATIWSSVYRMLTAYFETVTNRQLEKGLKILVKVSVEFHEIYGISLNVLDIDPVYTVGEQERHRQEIIKRLDYEGIIDMNKTVELPLVMQRLAVISSASAAGYGDFIHQLETNDSNYSYSYTLFPSQMQGQQTAESIINNLDKIYKHESEFDAVVIIRGGGSKSDLAWFDNYELAANIAQFPLPVITGIGHDRDQSIADIVAHTTLKTPTAVAEFLINRTETFEGTMIDLAESFTFVVSDLLANFQTALNATIHDIKPLLTQRISNYKNNIEKKSQAFAFLCKSSISRAEDFCTTTTHEAYHKAMSQINTLHNNQLNNSKSIQNALHDCLKTNNHLFEIIEEKVASSNPLRILAKGYTLAFDEQGKIIHSAKEIVKDSVMYNQFIDGKVSSRVL